MRNAGKYVVHVSCPTAFLPPLLLSLVFAYTLGEFEILHCIPKLVSWVAMLSLFPSYNLETED
jgi:hypothetical protein